MGLREAKGNRERKGGGARGKKGGREFTLLKLDYASTSFD